MPLILASNKALTKPKVNDETPEQYFGSYLATKEDEKAEQDESSGDDSIDREIVQEEIGNGDTTESDNDAAEEDNGDSGSDRMQKEEQTKRTKKKRADSLNYKHPRNEEHLQNTVAISKFQLRCFDNSPHSLFSHCVMYIKVGYAHENQVHQEEGQNVPFSSSRRKTRNIQMKKEYITPVQ